MDRALAVSLKMSISQVDNGPPTPYKIKVISVNL